MTTKLRLGVMPNNQAPITLAEGVYMGDGTDKTIKDLLLEGAGTTSLKHNFATTGSVKFTINFNDKTISNTTWILCTNIGYYTQTTNSITIPDSVLSDNSNMYYLISESSGYKIVKTTDLISDNGGNIVCGIFGSTKTVYPILYPVENLYVVGGKMYGNDYKSIGKVANIGDSITFSGCMSLDIPVVQKLAMNGQHIIGETNAMSAQADKLDEDVDLVTILGGTNDEGDVINSDTNDYNMEKVGTLMPVGDTKDKTTFYGAYQYIIEKCYEKNPNVKIILCCPPRAWQQSEPYTERTNLKLVGDLVKKVADFYSLPCVDLWHECPINEITKDIYLSDKLHPNSNGCTLIGNKVKGEIKKSYCGE
jgi:lysophospholipase L1-like esterase